MGGSDGPFASLPDEADRPDPYGLQGTAVGHYAIEEVIGSGGMGVVYRAEDTRLRRAVALKFLPPRMTRDAHAAERFLAEARAASALDHPNICTVHEIGETADGHPFIAMAYCPGASLRERLEAGPLTPEAATALAVQVARGLHRAHEAGIVHRDVKPGNVMVTPDERVKLVDFGVARMGDSLLTQTGASVGTPSYMSPEQTRGAEVDARTDQWALGVMLHEMLAGERPFGGTYAQAIVYSILHEDPPPIPGVPDPLAAVVARCLQKDPAHRYPDTGALADALDAFLKSGTAAPVPGQAAALPPRRSALRGRLGWIAGGVAALVLAVVGVVAWPDSDEPLPFATAGSGQQVAVLPFTNVGGDPANQAFIDGLVYTVGATLTEMEQFSDRISVLPTDDARALEGRSPREAAQELGADVIVSGSVQRSAERVRLTMEVYDAATDRRLGSRVLDKTVTDLLALQDSVALELATLLDLELNEAARTAIAAGGTSSPQAFDLYTQARGTLLDYEDEAVVDRAVSLFERAVAADGDYALAWAGLGEAFWRKYEASNDPQWVDRAAVAGERAVALNPDLAPVRVTLGIIYKGTGRNEDAERELRRALAIDGSDALAHRYLGSTLFALGRVEEAIPAYRRAIALKPGYWGFYNNLGNVFLLEDRDEEAIGLFRQVVALRPDNPWGYGNLGLAYQNLGRLDSAAYWYRRGTVANPSATGATAAAYAGLGQVDFDRGEFEAATQALRRAVALDSTESDNWYYLGNAYHFAGRPAEAERAWRRMIALDEQVVAVNPDDPNGLIGLAHGYAWTGQAARARQALDRLVALPQKGSFLSLIIAQIYERLGERTLALDSLREGMVKGLEPGEIERSPWLDDLREDARYRRLLSTALPS